MAGKKQTDIQWPIKKEKNLELNDEPAQEKNEVIESEHGPPGTADNPIDVTSSIKRNTRKKEGKK